MIGRTIADRYRVDALLGEGGMGVVYVAEHLMLGRKVALKHLHPELAADQRAVLRFQQEARAAAATGHEHIVEVLDLGFADDGAPFLVMEYLRGETLGAVLRRERRISIARAKHIVAQTLDALSAVHERGIVHRDLKPDNIFLTHRSGMSDYVKVLDFGVSKISNDDGMRLDLTHTGVVLGTPYYMSPEQARGVRDLDHRVDLYAVGVILYQALSGRLPFDAENYHALLQAILGAEPPPLESVAPGLPDELRTVVERAISRDRRQRFPDARSMAEALLAEDAPRSEIVPPDNPTSWGVGGPSTAAGLTHPSAEPTAARKPLPRIEVTKDFASRTSLTPEPVGEPRHFVARSDNWVDPDTDRTPRPNVRSSSKDRSPSPPPSSVPPAHPSVRTPTSSRPLFLSHPTDFRPRVRGAMLRAVHAWVEQAAGAEGHARLLAALGPPDRDAVRGVILPSTWFSLELLHRHLDVVGDQFGRGSIGPALEIGSVLATAHGSHLRLSISDIGAQPHLIADRFPLFWRAFHGSGHCQVTTDETSARVEVMNLRPDHAMHAAMMAGFFRTVLADAGVKGATAALVSSTARGDAATVLELRWT